MHVDFRVLLECGGKKVVAARIYRSGNYERRSKWQGCFVLEVDRGQAWGSLLCGLYNMEVFRQTESYLTGLGCRVLELEVKGSIRRHVLRRRHVAVA